MKVKPIPLAVLTDGVLERSQSVLDFVTNQANSLSKCDCDDCSLFRARLLTPYEWRGLRGWK